MPPNGFLTISYKVGPETVLITTRDTYESLRDCLNGLEINQWMIIQGTGNNHKRSLIEVTIHLDSVKELFFEEIL